MFLNLLFSIYIDVILFCMLNNVRKYVWVYA